MTTSYRTTFIRLTSFIFILFSTLLLSPPFLFGIEPGTDKRLLIAAASNLRFALDDIVSEFNNKNRADIKISYGASGNLFAQIVAGAPFDLFFSADTLLPRKLIKEDYAEPGSFFIYGAGQIVLWVPLHSEIDLERENLDVLFHPSINKIAIANPRHAPYGLAAITVLKNRGFYNQLHKKLVIGENVSQAADFVRKGFAEIGIFSYSLAVSSPLKNFGHYWVIPSKIHTPLEQAVVILQKSHHIAHAKSFLDFLKKGKGRKILNDYGYIIEDRKR